jgi:serine/threonine protein kinase
VFNTKNNLYFALELCNTDLQEYINVKATIEEAEAIDILKNIIAGYKSIWKHDIVHRDLKPSNILLQGE